VKEKLEIPSCTPSGCGPTYYDGKNLKDTEIVPSHKPKRNMAKNRQYSGILI
jgi:hypothetical protein